MLGSQISGAIYQQLSSPRWLAFSAASRGTGEICTRRLSSILSILRNYARHSCFMIVALLMMSYVANGVKAQGSGLDSVLSAWIEDDLHFLFDSNNRPKLAIRRKPIRAYIYSEIRSAEDDIRLAISLFSQAAGVPFEFTSLDPNILAVVTAPISEGGKPNRGLLKRLNLPDNVVDEVVAGGDWSSGCGPYSFGDAQGEISLSLLLADKNLSARDLKDCINEGVIRAFGIRTKRTSAIRSIDGYFQYLLLTKALRYCDSEIGGTHQDIAVLRTSYTRCAKEFMKRMITSP